MILDKLFQKLKLNKQLNACLLCSKPVELMSECENLDQIVNIEENVKPNKRKRTIARERILEQFFHENQYLLKYKEFIPEKLLYYTPYKKPQYMYLICPNIAEKVANHILPSINSNKNQVVAEANPGLGIITNEMIKKGIPVVRLYEFNTAFQQVLKNIHETHQDRLELFKKDFFKLYLYSHVDKFDQGHRVTSLLEGVPKKNWVDDPVMTVVGVMTDTSFLRYLIKSIVMQREIATYGRIEIFALMFPSDWAVMISTKEANIHKYRPWTLLVQIFFEIKLLDEFPKKFFLPWQSKNSTSRKDVEQENLYLIQISMKKNFGLNTDELVPFFCFIRTFLGAGNKIIIPTCEKWVPGCGINLIVPKLKHEDYFEDLNTFTKFKELNPKQIVAVFREITSLPQYHSSPFMDMVEQELIKSETISSDIHATHRYKKKIIDFETIF